MPVASNKSTKPNSNFWQSPPNSKVSTVGEGKFASENLPSEQESDIISGEFEKDMARFEKSSPDLLAILEKHQLVFGPLPSHEKGQTLVQMDLCLKKDVEKGALRTKFSPMPKPDQLEIAAQALEMVKAGLAEEYT